MPINIAKWYALYYSTSSLKKVVDDFNLSIYPNLNDGKLHWSGDYFRQWLNWQYEIYKEGS